MQGALEGTGSPPEERSFPGRLSRSLTRVLAAGLLGVVLVGGTSLALAFQILRDNEAVALEYDHILQLDQLHSVFDDLIAALHQMDSTGRRDSTTDALLMQEDIERRLVELGKIHGGELGSTEKQHLEELGGLGRLSKEGLAVTKRLAAGTERLPKSDLDWLDRATHEVPRHADTLAEFHRSRIARRLEGSRGLLQAIVALYVAFILLGGGLVVAAGLTANRALAAPLRRLADAAEELAAGRLETRVRVRSPNEIGLLSHSFNLMASRLQEREQDLRRAQDALEEKVRETQALYRIGMEIARLQQLDRVLQSVVDKARELLRGDAVALCLFSPGSGGVVAQATSGPPEAFQPAREAARPPALVPGEVVGPIIRPEFVRAHLVAPLRLADEPIGEIWVSTRDEREFTADETELLAGLAAQASIAIERARLSEELRSLAAVEERERLAREMHDGLAQELGLLHMKLHSALARAADAPAVAEDLRGMVSITESAYESVRQSIFGLRTFVSRGLGLVPTLTEYLHEFSVQNGIAVDLEAAGALGPVPPATEVQAVRIIQEALMNVKKHAAAERARVRVAREGAWLRLAIEDDGVGWDRQASPKGLHFGLQMMRERAEGLGGRLDVEAAPGRGTRVVAMLPGGSA